MLKFLRLILVISSLFISITGQAQHLSVTGFSGNNPFVIQFDTAYESVNFYSVSIDVHNSDSVSDFANDILYVLLKADTNPIDTLYFGTGLDSIPALGSTTVTNPTYHFKAANFDDGDNIVVIWPVASMHPIIADTFLTHIYFQSITGIDELDKNPVRIYPNPATDYLYLYGLAKIKLKCVRITDASGKECYSGIPPTDAIPVKSFAKGIYYISIEETNGNRRVISMIKGE